MQDPSSLPQHLVSGLAYALSFSVAALSAVGCSHGQTPEPQHAQARDSQQAREHQEQDHAHDDHAHAQPQQTQPQRQSPERVEGPASESAPATAMDQSNEPADMEITRRIRAAVVVDSELSARARNCTIITRSGVVTLRGDVTQPERDRIAAHVHSVPGIVHVHDLLVVP